MQTLSDLLDEIEQARQIAIEQNKPSAMIQATMCKAKLLGLDKGDTLTIKRKHPTIPSFPHIRN